MKNRHKGETALVIGNGPTLSDVALEFLNSYPSFGTNRIYLLDGFTPDYYVVVNNLVIQQFNRDIKEIPTTKFIKAHYTKHLLTDGIPLNSSAIPAFSRSPLQWVYEGHTVTYVCLQLAYYMGFDTVLLVGVDHRYEFEGAPNEMVYAEGDDVNHFSPHYFDDGRRWNNPDLPMTERAYKMAKTVFDMEGRKIINLTPKSALDIFERGDIKDYE